MRRLSFHPHRHSAVDMRLNCLRYELFRTLIARVDEHTQSLEQMAFGASVAHPLIVIMLMNAFESLLNDD